MTLTNGKDVDGHCMAGKIPKALKSKITVGLGLKLEAWLKFEKPGFWSPQFPMRKFDLGRFLHPTWDVFHRCTDYRRLREMLGIDPPPSSTGDTPSTTTPDSGDEPVILPPMRPEDLNPPLEPPMPPSGPHQSPLEEWNAPPPTNQVPPAKQQKAPPHGKFPSAEQDGPPSSNGLPPFGSGNNRPPNGIRPSGSDDTRPSSLGNEPVNIRPASPEDFEQAWSEDQLVPVRSKAPTSRTDPFIRQGNVRQGTSPQPVPQKPERDNSSGQRTRPSPAPSPPLERHMTLPEWVPPPNAVQNPSPAVQPVDSRSGNPLGKDVDVPGNKAGLSRQSFKDLPPSSAGNFPICKKEEEKLIVLEPSILSQLKNPMAPRTASCSVLTTRGPTSSNSSS